MPSSSTPSLDLPNEGDETEESREGPEPNSGTFLQPTLFASPQLSKERKRVRFRIVTADSGIKIFTPDDPAPMPAELGTAPSRWGYQQLTDLNATFDYNHEYSFGPLYRLPVPAAMENKITLNCNRIISLPTQQIENREIDWTELGHHWGSLYNQLLKILARKYEAIIKKQTLRNPMQTPPDRQTVPINPNFSKDSNRSVGSTSSKAEPYTRNYSVNFLSELFDGIGPFLPGQGALAEGNFHVAPQMRFMLGFEEIEATDDGGLCLTPSVRFPIRNRSPPPFISIEAKRKKNRQRNWPSTYYAHAGQIYAEMLGQVCFKELYDNPHTSYQEAFVIHSRHATFRLFYAKFPNRYLQNIVKYGASYRQRIAPHLQDLIVLHQSTGYHMQNLQQQAEFYRLISKLVYYVLSGSSHVGFLRNCPGNPYLSRQPFDRTNFDNLVGTLRQATYPDGVLDGELSTDEE